MLNLTEQSSGAWIFVNEYPDGVNERFDEILELFDTSRAAVVEEELKTLLLVCPDHIDALHHLAILFSHTGRNFESYLCLREAARVGLLAIPPQFSWLTGRIEWGYLPNRPFMRAYHALGLCLLKEHGPAAAIDIFARLVSVNPNDNLGARSLLMQCSLGIADWNRALSLAQNYPNDSGPDITYSKVVALLQLELLEEASEGIKNAVQLGPNVAKELLKTRHVRPKSQMPGFITSGGEDQAFDYWERNRSFWSSGTEALKLLKSTMAKR